MYLSQLTGKLNKDAHCQPSPAPVMLSYLRRAAEPGGGGARACPSAPRRCAPKVHLLGLPATLPCWLQALLHRETSRCEGLGHQAGAFLLRGGCLPTAHRPQSAHRELLPRPQATPGPAGARHQGSPHVGAPEPAEQWGYRGLRRSWPQLAGEPRPRASGMPLTQGSWPWRGRRRTCRMWGTLESRWGRGKETMSAAPQGG